VDRPDDVFVVLNSIWKYCTQDWLSLRIPNEQDDTKSRWLIQPWWDELSNCQFNSRGEEAVRGIYKGINLQEFYYTNCSFYCWFYINWILYFEG